MSSPRTGPSCRTWNVRRPVLAVSLLRFAVDRGTPGKTPGNPAAPADRNPCAQPLRTRAGLRTARFRNTGDRAPTGADAHVTGLAGPASRPLAVPPPTPRVTLSGRPALYRIEGRHGPPRTTA